MSKVKVILADDFSCNYSNDFLSYNYSTTLLLMVLCIILVTVAVIEYNSHRDYTRNHREQVEKKKVANYFYRRAKAANERKNK